MYNGKINWAIGQSGGPLCYVHYALRYVDFETVKILIHFRLWLVSAVQCLFILGHINGEKRETSKLPFMFSLKIHILGVLLSLGFPFEFKGEIKIPVRQSS
jgi:hypothetical protein